MFGMPANGEFKVDNSNIAEEKGRAVEKTMKSNQG